MDPRSIEHVLKFLRELRLQAPNSSVLDMISSWAPGDQAAQIRIIAHISEQCQLAKTVVENSALPKSSQEGVKNAIAGAERVLSLNGVSSPWQSNVGDITSATTILEMLVTFAGKPQMPDPPQDVYDLVGEIEALSKSFEDPDLDPVVRQVAQRHLMILATLLRHLSIVGLEEALTAYFELVTKVRRADTGASPASTEKISGIWPTIKQWGDRLGAIDRIWNSGAKLLNKADDLGLLDYMPDL